MRQWVASPYSQIGNYAARVICLHPSMTTQAIVVTLQNYFLAASATVLHIIMSIVNEHIGTQVINITARNCIMP